MSSFNEALLACVPVLLRSTTFAKALRTNLPKELHKLIKEAKTGLPIGDDVIDEWSDAVRNAFNDAADDIVSLGWDSDSPPGGSGAFWLTGLKGVYIITSSDVDPMGPFGSLDEALDSEVFTTPTAGLSLDSKTLSKATMLKIAKSCVDWESDDDVWINGNRYRKASGKKLVKVRQA